jgi:hypothetical protein
LNKDEKENNLYGWKFMKEKETDMNVWRKEGRMDIGYAWLEEHYGMSIVAFLGGVVDGVSPN